MVGVRRLGESATGVTCSSVAGDTDLSGVPGSVRQGVGSAQVVQTIASGRRMRGRSAVAGTITQHPPNPSEGTAIH